MTNDRVLNENAHNTRSDANERETRLPYSDIRASEPKTRLPYSDIRASEPKTRLPYSDIRAGETKTRLPYSDIRVVEFTHMVMGPTCGMLLADLGAEVIKVEPLKGDNTRKLLGSGAGFYPLFNRNKKSVTLDLSTNEGREAAHRLIATADIVSHNFRPETMASQGLDYETVKRINPRAIYISLKGFLPGPYEHRTALDEVVQMMGGLAYMTGPVGQPLRAGSSVNDIMGGLFGAIAAMAALRERERTGLGQEVQSALYENNIFLVAQHMMQYAVTGKAADPMPNRISAWGVYDVFTVKNGEQIFLSAVSDKQWAIFCEAFGFDDLKNDAMLAANNDRVRAREWLIPELRKRFENYSAQELTDIFEAHGLPYAPIKKPHELLDDPHLLATGGLAPMNLPDGRETVTALFPFTMNGERMGVRMNPPKLGEHNDEILRALGYNDEQIDALTKHKST
jgi:crotonobetainyl-CoA:carnitine CoA-transferase CaiB-like acyl-CoA transferase